MDYLNKFIAIGLLSLFFVTISIKNVLAMESIFSPTSKKSKYSYIINEEINITKIGEKKSFEFINKYRGKYIVGIILENFSDDLYYKPISERYKLNLKLEIVFIENDNVIRSYITNESYDPFIGREDSGLILFFYTTPKDLPIQKQITCKVKVIETDEALYNNNGPTKFYIKKISDK